MNSRSFRVRMRIPRALPQTSASARAASWMSPREMIVLRVGSLGDKPSSVDTFWGWVKMTLRSEWLMLFGLGFELARGNGEFVTKEPYMYSLFNRQLMTGGAQRKV